MEAVRSICNQDTANTLDNAMQVLFAKLDDSDRRCGKWQDNIRSRTVGRT